MVKTMEIPLKIRSIINEKYGKKDRTGMSGAAIYLFDDMVLKVQEQNSEANNEYTMMQWLLKKVPVPKIIEHELANKLSYLLMSRCTGEMACSDTYMKNPKYQADLLAGAIQRLWSVDITDCPSDCRLKYKLQQAEYNVTNGLVNTDNCEPDTFGKNGFRSPENLLYWLQDNAPDEEPVLSHGDFCLPNVMFADGTLSGFIDLGRSGIADKWCDIAICHRSIKHNYDGSYTSKPIPGYNEAYFFDALQIQPDWDKIRYYILLDELF